VLEISVRERKDLELQDFVLVTICLHSNRGYMLGIRMCSLQDFLKKDVFEICYCFQVRNFRRRAVSRAHPLSAADPQQNVKLSQVTNKVKAVYFYSVNTSFKSTEGSNLV
jgi:hypothetical protein